MREQLLEPAADSWDREGRQEDEHRQWSKSSVLHRTCGFQFMHDPSSFATRHMLLTDIIKLMSKPHCTSVSQRDDDKALYAQAQRRDRYSWPIDGVRSVSRADRRSRE